MNIDFKSKQTQLIGAGILVAAVFALALLAGGGSREPAMPLSSEAPSSAEPETSDAPESTDETAKAASETKDAQSSATGTSAPVATDGEETLKPLALSEGDLKAALSERSLGKSGAPVTITEYSSLTCSHCGAFHKNVFKKLKTDMIDTGKARLVISDFPLNGPALHAAMVARCLPQDKYFDYIQLLFETQEQWAYSPDYKKYLKQNAQLAGLSAQKFEDCVNSEPLQKGILALVQKAQKEHEINATPTFILNGKTKLQGEQKPEDFEKAVVEAAKAQ